MDGNVGAVMVVWLDFPSQDEAAINDWYNREHVASRACLPGFLWGKRFVALEGEPKYLALYAAEGTGALTTPRYLEALSNPDANERRNVSRFYNAIRTICDVTASEGRWEGGVMAFLRLQPSAERAEALRAHVVGTVLPGLAAGPGIVAAHLLETNREVLATATVGLTPAEAEAPAWVVAVEATDAEAIQAARRQHLATGTLREKGAGPHQRFGVYRLMLRVEG